MVSKIPELVWRGGLEMPFLFKYVIMVCSNKDRLSKKKEHPSLKQNSRFLDIGYLNAVSFEYA